MVEGQLRDRINDVAVHAPEPVPLEDARPPTSVCFFRSRHEFSYTTAAARDPRLPDYPSGGILPPVNADPRLSRIERALADRGRTAIDPEPGRAQAAVALVLRARDDLELLLIRRAERPGDPWSGHIALPGGRRGAGDADLATTAFRETREETGISILDGGRVLGRLGVLTTPSRLPSVEITSFVAAVPADITLSLDPVEVVDAAWIPLSVLRSVEAASEHRFERAGEQLAFPSIVHGAYTIWGLTHRILMDFIEVMDAAGL
jgi:8-oxo-dGTP pyrophosphatase MutT (NUDIX family)